MREKEKKRKNYGITCLIVFTTGACIPYLCGLYSWPCIPNSGRHTLFTPPRYGGSDSSQQCWRPEDISHTGESTKERESATAADQLTETRKLICGVWSCGYAETSTGPGRTT